MMRTVMVSLTALIGAAGLIYTAGCSSHFILPQKATGAADAAASPADGPMVYKILSFFFDGVPAPVRPRLSGKAGEDKKEDKKNELGQYAEHGPFAAKLCNTCHMPSTNELIMPIGELCVYCHELKTDRRWVHGPVASGNCKVCHEPHGSPYRFFLVDEPKKFCYYCHDPKDVLKREVHQTHTGDQCTECHNAHASGRNFLLK